MDDARTTRPPGALEACLWVALLCLPGVLMLCGQSGRQDVLDSEFREPAPPPEWQGLLALPAWLDALQPWFDDALPYRDAFKSTINRALLRLGESGDAQVVVGKDGWLFTDHTTGDFLGTSEFSEPKLRRVLRTMRSRARWFAEHGAHYLLVIVPNKNTVYPELMPGLMRPSEAPSIRERVVQAFARFDDLDTLDLTQALRRAKQGQQVYYKHDTHWNERGALVAVREIHARLAERLPGFVPTDLDGVSFSEAPSDYGELIRSLALKGDVLEVVPSYVDPWEPEWRDYPLPPELDLPAGTTIKVFDNPEGEGTAVFLRDSFGEQVQPWIGKPFARFIDVKRIGSQQKRAALLQWLVEHERPELMLEELVERHLNRHLPGLFSAWE